MDSTNDKVTKNERKLWHGTPMDTIDSINTYGFNRSFGGRNGKLNSILNNSFVCHEF